MNRALLHKEVQDFIAANYKEDISKLLLKGSPFPGISVQELGVQLHGKRKAEKKLPTWFRTEGIIYPPGLNLEQTSSEVTAAYKASLVSGESIADITGGFGIDSCFFSRRFQKLVHCELDPSLSEVVAHNSEKLGISNTTHIPGDGIAFLKKTPADFSWIYLDPSRRSESGGRIYHLSDCLPNVPEHLELLLARTPNVLLKTSPFLDLQAGTASLKGVKEIHIIAVKNEVKELLWILEKNSSEEVRVRTRNFSQEGIQEFDGLLHDRPLPFFGTPRSYLYEPNAAIMKSGLFGKLGAAYDLEKLHPNSHLFTSEQLIGFPGRRFEILEQLPYSRKKIKKALSFDKAHIATRNFPESVAALRKQFKLQDGGDRYLFFTTTARDEKVLLICKKID